MFPMVPPEERGVNILVEYMQAKQATMDEHIEVMNELSARGLVSDNAIMLLDIADADAERALPAAKTHLQKLRTKTT